MKDSLWKLLVALCAVGMVAAACGDDDDEPAAAAPEPAEAAPEPEPAAPAEEAEEPAVAGPDLGDITTIRLVVNPWNGSAVNIEVAKQLLENELGYTVETTDLDENVQWAAINSGEMHASLEVWPSGHAENRADFIDNPNGNVVDAGLLGPIGKIGWYLPTYMVDQHPALATWEGLADPELAGLFATAETGDNGQFLTGDPSWVSTEQLVIDNLELPLEIIYTGSEEGIVAAIDAAIAREDPVLAYFWTPHSIHNAYDLTEVQLPEHTPECADKGDAFDCDYPADNLFKIVWAGLQQGAPAAWELLHNFNYTTDDQVSMLAAVEAEGMSVEEAAADWIAANEATWSAWIPS